MHARRSADLLQAGLTRKVLRGPRAERRSHGLYRPAGVVLEAQLERLDDALGVMVPGTVLGGWASLLLQGNDWFDGWAPDGRRRALVHCPRGTQLRRRDVVEPLRADLRPDERTEVGDGPGVAVSTMARAAFDEARLAVDLRSAVVALDMAASSVHGRPHTSLAEIRRIEGALRKVRGIVQVRRALLWASERSASPPETRTRLCATLDAGLSDLLVNAAVFADTGELLGVADLIDPTCGLVIETDGAGHREEPRHTLDNRREEAFEHAGCVVVRATPLDHRDLGGLAARIRRGHQTARRSSRRQWTVEAPAWWESWPGASPWL